VELKIATLKLNLGTELEETKTELKETNTKLEKVETELKETNTKLEKVETELKETKTESEETKTKLEKVETELGNERIQRSNLCIGNLLIDLAKIVCPSTATDASTHRLKQSASAISDKQLKDGGIPSKYWPYLRNLSKVYCGFLLMFIEYVNKGQ
jgi:chromosome segregation ATPase